MHRMSNTSGGNIFGSQLFTLWHQPGPIVLMNENPHRFKAIRISRDSQHVKKRTICKSTLFNKIEFT